MYCFNGVQKFKIFASLFASKIISKFIQPLKIQILKNRLKIHFLNQEQEFLKNHDLVKMESKSAPLVLPRRIPIFARTESKKKKIQNKILRRKWIKYLLIYSFSLT
ncbi:hypothetical protein ACKWTF_010498 [Chironomus riparius]